ncbi:hypothetical protein F4809DRAFT_643333 [Biscogniauxia mediterranea]|nr:hypothetical protein F5X96DRAFT_388060 [Biscogniauxia mediterranea]KAI1634591.1 hypothetical protein F4809DRAFT_643333 [Biscogniauxia mediterranea]
MFATRVLRQAAAHGAERTPLIRFIGKRTIPTQIDHTPRPHPASPTGALPGNGNSYPSFSLYRDSAQQHGPLRKTIGTTPAAKLGSVEAPKGVYFDRNELPERFRRTPLTLAEIEAVETGGAALFG